MTALTTFRPAIETALRGDYVAPVTCEVDLSGVCQNRCSWCYFDGRLGDGLMTEDTFTTLLIRLSAISARSITFTGGGEPLTHPEFSRFARQAVDAGFKVGLITNGIFLDRHLAVLPLFEFVRVSLDAATPETYRAIKGRDYFARVVRNIERIVPVVPTGLSFVVCEQNVHEQDAVQELAATLGVRYLQFKPNTLAPLPINANHGSRVTHRYAPDGTGAPCRLAALVGVVTPNGDAYFCCQKRGLPEYRVGNVRDDSFAELWAARAAVTPHDCDTCRYMNYVRDDDTFPENGDFL